MKLEPRPERRMPSFFIRKAFHHGDTEARRKAGRRAAGHESFFNEPKGSVG
jgi:hypothetical protein